jgi:acetyl-CoA carboxylase carboxyl transferase subunit alpha
MNNYLDFEKSLAEIEGKAEELRAMARANEKMDVEKEAAALDKKAGDMLRDLYKALSPWQKCQVARHPDRPHCRDYIETLFTEYTPLAGDRNFADDHAVMGGLARFEDRPVVVIGHEKGHDTKTRIERNFGMARPEGYRKAIRLMDLAHRFGLPVITLVDTPGAYPGKGAEERGQSEAIARSTEKCLQIGVPVVSVVIGEGGSGGAVAFATANKVAMLEHSIYSVISPEGCASILWKDAEKMKEAAEALRLTAQDLKSLGVIDRIIGEPAGGAQRDRAAAIGAVGKALAEMLKELGGRSPGAARQGPAAEVPRHGVEGARRLRAQSGTKPASAISAFDTVSISNSRRVMNSSRGRPAGSRGRNSTTAVPGRRRTPRLGQKTRCWWRPARSPGRAAHKGRRCRSCRASRTPGATRVPCG